MSRTVSSSNGTPSSHRLFRDNICVEYVLEINDLVFDSLFSTSKTNNVETKANCRIGLTPTTTNDRINFNRWAKFAIVQIIGPDESSLAQCLSLLEQQFPIFLHRKEYSRRANVTIITEELNLPQNKMVMNKVQRSDSTKSCREASVMDGSLVNIGRFPAIASDPESNSLSALPFRRHSQPSLSLNSNRFTIFDSKTDKLSRSEIFGLLSALSKNTQSVGDPSIANLDNVTVRISFDYLDNEAGEQNDPLFPEMKIETTDEPLLSSRIPRYEPHTGANQIPGRPIEERKRIPEKHYRGLYDNEGRPDCGGGSADTGSGGGNGNDHDNDDAMSHASSINISITIETKTGYGGQNNDDNIPKASNANTARPKSIAPKPSNAVQKMEPKPSNITNKSTGENRQLHVSVSSSESQTNVQLQYIEEVDSYENTGGQTSVNLNVTKGNDGNIPRVSNASTERPKAIAPKPSNAVQKVAPKPSNAVQKVPPKPSNDVQKMEAKPSNLTNRSTGENRQLHVSISSSESQTNVQLQYIAEVDSNENTGTETAVNLNVNRNQAENITSTIHEDNPNSAVKSEVAVINNPRNSGGQTSHNIKISAEFHSYTD